MSRFKITLLICIINGLIQPLVSNQSFDIDLYYQNSLSIDSSSIDSNNIAVVLPSFPRGEEGLMRFIFKNLQYPTLAKQNGAEGKVVIAFVINEDGTISDIKPHLQEDKQLGYGLEEEAMRIISIMPRWTPGYNNNNEPVKVQFLLPIIFSLPNYEDSDDKTENKKRRKRN